MLQWGWKHPQGYLDIGLYKGIARLLFAFTLEGFVFILVIYLDFRILH